MSNAGKSRETRTTPVVRLVAAACLLVAGASWAGMRTPPVQPGTIQPAAGMRLPTREPTIWVFADIKVTVLGPTTLRVAWQSREGAAAYRIVRNGVVIADVPHGAPPLAFVDDGLTPGATGTYSVQALQAPPPPTAPSNVIRPDRRRGGATSGNTLAPDIVLEVSRTVAAMTPPLAPATHFTASTISLNAVRLGWTSPNWATGYQVWRDRQAIKQGRGNAVDDTSLSPGTYVYAVQSMFAKADGTSIPGPISQEVSVRVGPAVCMPGSKRPCDYRGSAGTSHCPVGEQTCNEKGDGYGLCEDSQYRCGAWDIISFKECAFTGRAKYVGVLRDIPSGDSKQAYVLKHKATVQGVDMNAMAFSQDPWGNAWGSFAVSTSQCFVYNFNFFKTCTSPLTGSVLYEDPNTRKTLRESTFGPCLSTCFGSNERKVYNSEPSWGTEPFLSGGAGPPRCETIVSKEFEW
jgi:hypothetical protein